MNILKQDPRPILSCSFDSLVNKLEGFRTTDSYGSVLFVCLLG